MEYYTIFIPVQYEVDADIPVQYEVDADIPVQDEVDADIPVQYEVDADIPVQYEVDDEMAKCCIYRVPKFIKKGKKECYQPFVISIGPIFYNLQKLKAMEELKDIYLECFLEHPDNVCQSLERYKNFVRRHESKIRKCYQQQIRIPSEEFIHMIVRDAAFLIYLFVRRLPSPSSDQTELRTHVNSKLISLKKFVRPDVLYVGENQLPFFVLTHMYNIAYGESNLLPPSFINVALTYIGRNHPFLRKKVVDHIINEEILLPYASSIKHLLHLQRECCHINTSTCRTITVRKKGWQNLYRKIPRATELIDAGVKFEVNESMDLLDITFDKSSGVLKMPRLFLMDRNIEAFFRGILFFEQCYHKHQYINDYFTFLDALIDNVQDIRVLQRKEILQSYLGSDNYAVDLFHKFAKNRVFTSIYAFDEVSKNLNDYTSARWNRWKAILWKNYLNHPWAIISVVYATILLFLTLLQTISGVSSK